ncbi:MAG: TrpR YerC/YecD [Lachnospiraceae bacterium]|nr:TrpR YerC/YecD [Lachnospiraceae bacterium]
MKKSNDIRTEELSQLFQGILQLKTEEECYQFFEDVCTINELRSIAQRFDVAVKLSKKQTYTEIEESTKASSATISRVNRALNYGKDGYRLVIERMKEEK